MFSVLRESRLRHPLANDLASNNTKTDWFYCHLVPAKDKTLARLRDLKAIGRTEKELVVEIKCGEEFEAFWSCRLLRLA